MSELKVVFSSINFATSPHALRSPEWLGEFAKEAGFDGVEYMPQFDLLPGHTPRAVGRAVKSGALALNSQHATFRTRPSSADTNQMPGEAGKPGLTARVMNSPLGRLILPEVVESAAVLAEIQREAGVQVPAVLFPQGKASRDRVQIEVAEASQHLFQPTDHTARLVGTTTIGAYNRIMTGARGYRYVYDTFHGRRLYGRDEPGIVSDVKKFIPAAGDKIEAIHLSVYRTDIGGEDHIPTVQEAQQVAKGQYIGALGETLDVIKEYGNVQFAVVEMLSGNAAQIAGSSDIRALQGVYSDMADGLRAYWTA